MSNGSETPQYSGHQKGIPAWVWILLAIPLILAPFVKRGKPPAINPTPKTQAALHFPLIDASGVKQSIADFKGKTVLFSFWASWCGPCVAEMPALAKLESRFKDRPFQLVMVNVDETVESIKGVIKLDSVPGKVFFGGSVETLNALGVQSIPFTLLLDRDGNIRESYLGEQNWEDPAKIKAIETWLGASPQ